MTFEAVIAWATAIGAAATVCYAVVAARQLKAIGRQANITERTITDIERPWLLPKCDITNWKGALDSFPIDMWCEWSVTNHGKGPAWITRGSDRFIVMDLPLDGDPPHKMDAVIDMPVAPGDTHARKIALENVEKCVTDVRNGTAAITLLVSIEYRDAWGGEHTSKFCFTWKAEGPAEDKRRTIFSTGGPAFWTEYT